MRQTINKGRTSYDPNSLGSGYPRESSEEERGYSSYAEKIDAHKVRARSESFDDHFSQATLFWNSQSEAEKKHLVSACHFELGKVEDMEVRKRIVGLFNQVDGEFAKKVAAGIGVDPPSEPGGTGVTKSSPAISMENTVKDTVKSRRIVILAADGFDHGQLTGMKEALEGAGASVKIVSQVLGPIKSRDNQEVKVDKNYVTTASIMFDAVYIPGGEPSVETLKSQGDALHFINEAFKHGKAIAASGEAIDLLSATQIRGVDLAGPEGVLADHGVVTTRQTEQLEELSKAFIDAIARHRHWDREMKDQVPA